MRKVRKDCENRTRGRQHGQSHTFLAQITATLSVWTSQKYFWDLLHSRLWETFLKTSYWFERSTRESAWNQIERSGYEWRRCSQRGNIRAHVRPFRIATSQQTNNQRKQQQFIVVFSHQQTGKWLIYARPVGRRQKVGLLISCLESILI